MAAPASCIRVFGFGPTGKHLTWTMDKKSLIDNYGDVEGYGINLVKFNSGASLVAWIECEGSYFDSADPKWGVQLAEAIAKGNTFDGWQATLARTTFSSLAFAGIDAPPAKVTKPTPADRWWNLPAPDAPGFADRAMAAVRASSGAPSHD